MTAADGSPARVLVVWCPDWPVVAAGADMTASLAVLAAGRVAACSASARDAGVRRGQRLREAQHHCPDLVATPRDEGREARAFEQVLAVVEEFCPRVEVTRPGLCALGARGPARYFGGEEALAGKLAAALAERGFGCRIGIADGLFAGELAARAGHTGVVVPPGGTPAVPGRSAGHRSRFRGPGGSADPAGHPDAGGIRRSAAGPTRRTGSASPGRSRTGCRADWSRARWPPACPRPRSA